MAAGTSVLASRPVVAVGSSLSGKRVVLRGRDLNVCGVPAWERRRKRSARCACSSATSRSETESIDVKFNALTLYERLGISRQVGLPEIKTAYRERARRYHPDANPPSKRDECTKMFLQVQEAYEVLADPASRADYDYKLKYPLSMNSLTSGFSYKWKNRKAQSAGVDEEGLNKKTWRSQWEAQVDGLKRDFRRRKGAGSWAATLQQKRQEAQKDVTDSK